MALTIADQFEQGALDGGLAKLNTGSALTDATGDFRLMTGTVASPGTELAQLTLANPAFAASTSASGLTSSISGTIVKDTTITAGTITVFQLRDRANLVLLAGTVGTSGADLNVSDNVIPGTATEVTCDAGLTLTLQLS
jgi:hypothetical protein